MAESAEPAAPLAGSFRCLMRAARVASLATAGGDGHPFASLATPAFLPDLSPVLLLSTLSEHTRQLQGDPRCALLVGGVAPEVNPQTTPRITLICTAAVDADPAVRARYLAVHPYAQLYADFGDFAFWRLSILRASFVGGFARAGRLAAAALQPPAAAVAAIAAAEAGIIAHCNADHADALSSLAGGGAWRMVTADVDGCDLAGPADAVQRVAWEAPVADAAALRAALIARVQQSRSG